MAVLALALAVGAALPSQTLAATPEHQLEMKAREAFAGGKYDEALGLFAKLYAETLHPVYLRNIGRCHQKMRQPDQATDSFKDYLAKAKKITREDEAEVEGYIREMDALKEEQARAARPPVAPTTTTTTTDPPPLPNRLSAVEPPLSTGGEGGAGLIAKEPPPPLDEPTPVYKRWWFWTGIGVVVAGGVAGALLLSRKGSPCPADQCM